MPSGRAGGFLGLIFVLSLALVNLTILATTLFLTHAGASALPLFFVALALVSTPVSGLVTRLQARHPTLLLMAGLWVGMALLALGGWLVGIQGRTAAFLFYLGASLVELLLLSLSGVLLRDYFTLRECRRLTGPVSLMLALGGLTGALLVSLAAVRLTPAQSLWIVSLTSALGLWLLRGYHRGHRPLEESADEDAEGEADGSRGILGSVVSRYREYPLLGWLTLGVAGAVLVQCLQGVLAFSIYEGHFDSESDLTVFLGLAFALLHLSSLVLAALVPGVLLQRVGVVHTHLVFPLFNVASFLAVAVFGRLWTGVMAQIASDPMDSNVNSPTTVLFYNALPARLIGRSLLFDDGTVYPVSLGVAGALLMVMEPRMELAELAGVGIALSLGLLYVHVRTGMVYRKALAAQARQGSLRLQGAGGPTADSAGAGPSNPDPDPAELEAWLAELRVPAAAPRVAARLARLEPPRLRRVLRKALPKLVDYPLESLVQLVRRLPHEDQSLRDQLVSWYRRHWGLPLFRIHSTMSFVAAVDNPGERRVIEMVVANYRRRAQRLLLELLRPLDPEDRLQGLEIRLKAGDVRQQAQALETLSMLPDRRLTCWVDWLFDPAPVGGLRNRLARPAHGRRRLLRALGAAPDPWIFLMLERLGDPEANRSVNHYRGAAIMERLELLRRIPLFARLDLDDLESLDAQLEVRQAGPGELLFSEGDPADCLYVLVSGEIEVSMTGTDGNRQIIAVLGAGQPVGEMGLVDEAPRSASVRTRQSSEFLRLDRLSFHSLVMQRPQILLAMCQVLAARLRSQTGSG